MHMSAVLIGTVTMAIRKSGILVKKLSLRPMLMSRVRIGIVIVVTQRLEILASQHNKILWKRNVEMRLSGF